MRSQDAFVGKYYKHADLASFCMLNRHLGITLQLLYCSFKKHRHRAAHNLNNRNVAYTSKQLEGRGNSVGILWGIVHPLMARFLLFGLGFQ